MGIIAGKRKSNIKVLTKKLAVAGMAQCTECQPANQKVRSPVRFPVRAHVWAVGQVPSRRHGRENCTLMVLSLSFSFPFPFTKNK